MTVTKLVLLIDLLHDRVEDVQRSAVAALGGTGSGAVVAVPALTDLAATSDCGYLQIELAGAFGAIGPGAVAALPILDAWSNADCESSPAAREAIGRITAAE